MKRSLPLAVLIFLTSITTLKAEIVFDAITGATAFGSTGNTFTGQTFAMGGTARAVNQVRIFVANTSGATLNLSDLRVRFQLYDGLTLTQANAFSNPLGALTVANFGAVTFANNSILDATITLATPIAINDGVGAIAINWQGNTGAGFNNITGLSTAFRGGAAAPAFAVGSVAGLGAPNYGFFRNASGRTDFNFNGTTPGPFDAVTAGANSALALQISATPEPGSLILMSVAGLGFWFLRRRGLSIA